MPSSRPPKIAEAVHATNKTSFVKRQPHLFQLIAITLLPFLNRHPLIREVPTFGTRIADLITRRELAVPQPYLQDSLHLLMEIVAPLAARRFHFGDVADGVNDRTTAVRPLRIDLRCSELGQVPADVHLPQELDVFWFDG